QNEDTAEEFRGMREPDGDLPADVEIHAQGERDEESCREPVGEGQLAEGVGSQIAWNEQPDGKRNPPGADERRPQLQRIADGDEDFRPACAREPKCRRRRIHEAATIAAGRDVCGSAKGSHRARSRGPSAATPNRASSRTSASMRARSAGITCVLAPADSRRATLKSAPYSSLRRSERRRFPSSAWKKRG